jgi:hypothetical protein
MKNNFTIQSIIKYLLVLSFILWVGSYICRHLLIYQMFEPKELELRSIFTSENLNSVFFVILPIIVTNIISYSAFLLLFIIYLITSKLSLRNEGWLFISMLIIFVTAPFEIYLLTKDYSIVSLIYREIKDPIAILDLIRKRITILSSFSLIEIFSYLAVVFLVITKPLVKSHEAKRERT